MRKKKSGKSKSPPESKEADSVGQNTHLELQQRGVFSQKYASEQPFMASVFSGHLFLSVSISN